MAVVKLPAWTAVEIRFPNVLKMLPRSPMAAGTMTSSPATPRKSTTRAPRKAPAIELVMELKPSATSDWRAAALVGPEEVDQPATPVEGPQWVKRCYVGPREWVGWSLDGPSPSSATSP